MSEVLFITPNFCGNVREEPVGTLLLATILRGHGIDTEILQFFHFGDTSNFDMFTKTALEMVLAKKPRIISFYTRCDTYHISLSLAQLFKKHLPQAYIVFGGPQSDISSFDTIREIEAVDFICCGEGENTIFPFFSSLLRGEPDLSVDGLVYRENGMCMQNSRPKMIEDLDTIPEIDYSFLQYNEDVRSQSKGLFPIDVGRGCPFGCTYCSTKSFWGRKYRLKSPERILREIQNVHRRFGVSAFNFEHDMFTMNKQRIIETCRLLKTLDFPITWRCSARIDCIDRELIDAMCDAGLSVLFVGIESGSSRMQKLINKNLKLDGVFELLEYIRNKGISVTASFIYGFPEETEEDVSMTIALMTKIAELKSIEIQAHLCTFLPGTELSARFSNEMSMTDTYSNITGNIAIEECSDLIKAHPKLFQHLMEYKTELRTKLEYFPVFFHTWRILLPVYKYIATKYQHTRLIDMYYDFVDANRTELDNNASIPPRRLARLIAENDAFVKKFSSDENYDIITDICRLKKVELTIEKGKTVTDFYCISPQSVSSGTPLEQYERGLYIVTHTCSPKGEINIKTQQFKE